MIARLKAWLVAKRKQNALIQPTEDLEAVRGERGVPSINRARPLQHRVSGALAMALLSAIVLGLLTWYYSQAFTRRERAHRAAEQATAQKTQGDVMVPPLRITQRPHVVEPEAAERAISTSIEPPAVERLLGSPPPLPPTSSLSNRAVPTTALLEREQARDRLLQRRLAGSALLTSGARSAASAGARGPNVSPATSESLAWQAALAGLDGAAGQPSISDASASGAPPSLEQLLTPSVVPAAQARLLPTRRLLLSRRTTIDCTLESAIDTSLPGFTSCITATDTFSDDGSTVLLERGTTLIGEARGDIRRGTRRVFVLWTEARIGKVVVPLDSPATDALGRAGIDGQVNRHFFERFGAAILISIIDGAIQGFVQSQAGSQNSVTVNPSASSQVMTEVLRSTMNVPPTLTVPQGQRIQVRVARDVDFRTVYALRSIDISQPHREGSNERDDACKEHR